MRSRIPLAHSTLALLVFSLSSSAGVVATPATEPAPRAAGAPASQETDAEALRSHEQMKEILARIARRMPHEETFGNAVPMIERALARLPDDAPPLQRAQNLGVLANALLQAGRTEAGIERLREVLALLETVDRAPPGLVVTGEFLLGVAQLHLARTAICLQENVPESCTLPPRVPPGGPGQGDLDEAMVHLERIVERLAAGHPMAIAATWLLNVAAMFADEYPEGVPAEARIDPAIFSPDVDFPRYPDVAPAAGLDTLSQAGGAIVDDFDGDELLDVMVSSIDPGAQVKLFRNLGDGSFADVTEEVGLEGIVGGLNMISGDYDSDGDVDVMVLRGAWMKQRGRWPNSLLRNDGGRFVDVALMMGMEPHYPTQAAAWADYDGDGDLDLYVANEADSGQPYPSQLFENRGDRFVDVAAAAGVENLRFGKGVTWGDYDNDGDPDLYVSNMGEPNRLYRNDGDGTFTDVASALGVEGPMGSFTAWFWDLDNDGHLDLLANAYEKGAEPGEAPLVWNVAAGRLGHDHGAPVPALYLADGQGGFEEIAAEAGIAVPTMPMGANFGDLDNDGLLDFYLGTGYPGLEGVIPNVMYRNLDGRSFEEVTFAGGFGHLGKGHGIAFADFDHDGDQDVFEQMGGLLPNDEARDALYENPGFGHHWLKLRLLPVEGRTSHGARVEVRVAGAGDARSLHRAVGSVAGFGGNPRRLEIGLGDADRIEALVVQWPGSEEPQVFENLSVDRFYEIRQEDGSIREVALPRYRLGGPE